MSENGSIVGFVRIPMHDAGYGDGEMRSDVEVIIRHATGNAPNISSLPARYLIGSIAAGYSARRDWMSSPVPGPWAFLIPLPSVLRGSGDVVPQPQAVNLWSGDVIEVDGVFYRIRFQLGGRGISSRYELDKDE
jgi:hypothetical protein